MFDALLYKPYSTDMNRSTKTKSKGVEQARQHLPGILAAAADGHTTVITRRGREIAAVVPIGVARLPKPVPLTALAGTGRGLWVKRSAQTVARLRDGWSR